MKWSDLAYWRSGEYQVVQERLKDYEKAQLAYCPSRDLLFDSLCRVPYEKVRVMVLGQDPYPTPSDACGVAFSVRDGRPSESLPPTLKNIFKVYQEDLHYPEPKSGDLTPWCGQGVLLWNVYPTCSAGKPGSHHWPEWALLTTEIVEKLNAKGNVVFVLLGRVAQQFGHLITCRIPPSGDVVPDVPVVQNSVVETSHPSPLGFRYGFLTSRVFSTVNNELRKLGQLPVNWKLP